MKVLVTGATGFLGSHVVLELRKRGHEVGCVVRAGSVLTQSHEGTSIWTVAEDGAGLQCVLHTWTPDVVVHLAALYICEHQMEDISPLIKTNIEFGAHLLDAMHLSRCGALVYAGTAWQHYRNQDYCPVNLYAATKQAFSVLADYYRDAGGLRLLELHLYDSYGPDDPRPKLLNRLLAAAETGQKLAMSDGKQRMHLVHVDDVSRGVAMACEQVLSFDAGERRIYRLPAVESVSLRELVAAVNSTNLTQQVDVEWGARPFRPREVFEPWDNAERLPGWYPTVSLNNGLRGILDHRRQVYSGQSVVSPCWYS